MKRVALLAAVALALSSGSFAQVLNVSNSEACNTTFDNSYLVQVVPGGTYTGTVLSVYNTSYSAGGSGRGGGYKPGHTTVTYSRIHSVTVKDANGKILATFTNAPTVYSGRQFDDQMGTFVSGTKYVTVEVSGACEYWYGTSGTTPVLAPGAATFTLKVTGPPLPPPPPVDN
jgi:hypothetical protein